MFCTSTTNSNRLTVAMNSLKESEQKALCLPCQLAVTKKYRVSF